MMKSVLRLKFFQRQENRLLVTLILSVLYPVLCAAMFAVFAFVIIPVSPLANAPKLWLHIYWISTAGIWLVLLAIFLPLMRDEDPNKIVFNVQRESGINLKRVTLMESDELLREDDLKVPRRWSDNSIIDESYEDSERVTKAEKETFLEDEFKSSPFQQRPFSSGSPPRERVVNSSDLLSETNFFFDDSIVKVHSPDDCTFQERSHSNDDLNKGRFLDSQNLGVKNHKNLSNQNLRATSRENIKKYISQDNIVKEDNINVTDEYVETLCEKGFSKIKQSKVSGQKFKIDIVKKETTVYECSLPSPEPLSPSALQNTVFLYVNKD